MIFDHTVISGGIIYKAGENVPMEDDGATEEVAPVLLEEDNAEEKPKRRQRTKKSE